MAKKKSKSKKLVQKSKIIKAFFNGENIVSEDKKSLDLYSNSFFGEYSNKQISYSFVEALYLSEKGKISVYYKNKKLTFSKLMEKCLDIDKKVKIKYIVYKDLRDRGYLLKTAFKFGAEFRVYNKGDTPGKDHAKWLLYSINENSEFTWHDFSAKNRVAHSTKKNLLLAIVDSDFGITYYEVSWIRP